MITVFGGMVLSSVLTATPTPNPDFDPTTVTPGVIGFITVLLFAVATMLLCIDVVRRIRRLTYRAQIKERLEAEIAAKNDESDAATPPADPRE